MLICPLLLDSVDVLNPWQLSAQVETRFKHQWFVGGVLCLHVLQAWLAIYRLSMGWLFFSTGKGALGRVLSSASNLLQCLNVFN